VSYAGLDGKTFLSLARKACSVDRGRINSVISGGTGTGSDPVACKLLTHLRCDGCRGERLVSCRATTGIRFPAESNDKLRQQSITFPDCSHYEMEKMSSVFMTTRRVEFCETDMAGIVHFSNFYRWMEQTEHEFYRSQGLTIVHRQDDGETFGWPRVQAHCRFHSPARYDDVLNIELRLQRIGVKSLTWESVFRIGERLVATGTMKTVCCVVRPGNALESVPIPEDYLNKLTPFEQRPASEKND
jgi:acyl-CoA thioester hydrolase